MRSLSLSISIAILLLAAVPAARAGGLGADDRALLAWFDGLGFPATDGKPFVRFTTGDWSQSGDGPRQANVAEGFLLGAAGEAFTVLTPDLFTWELVKNAARTEEQEPVGYVARDLGAAARERLESLRHPPEGLDFSLGRRLGRRAETVAFARACAGHGLPEVAHDLLVEAAKLPGRTDKPEASFRAGVAGEFAVAALWRAVVDCGRVSIGRPALLESFEALLRRYPESESAKEATGYRDLLRQMIAEDAAHAKAPAKALAAMTPDEQAVELIFRLRDQKGQQIMQPGSCDIFAGDEAGESPASRLVALGHQAVPRLIEALDDLRLTRSIEYWRDFVFSHHVVRVGACAGIILERIAGRSFEREGEGTVKQQARAWWKAVGERGERGLLIDAVVSGAAEPAEVERLVERYPADALAALSSGLKATRVASRRTAIARALAGLPGEGPVPALIEEAAGGPFVEARIAAAEGLASRGRPEGVAALIAEWARVTGRGDEPYTVLRLIGLLAGAPSVEAVHALGEKLRARPVGLRLAVLTALGKRDAAVDAAVVAAIEDLLAAALDDEAESGGVVEDANGQSLDDARVSEAAANALAERWPHHYRFDVSASRARRDAAIAESRNTWRHDRGLAPLPVPTPVVIAPVSAETVAPLVAKVRGAKVEADRGAAGAALEALGLGALPALRQALASVAPDDPARAALERSERRVASIVREVALAPGSVAPGAALEARLDALRGRPLVADALVGLLLAAAGALPDGAVGIQVAAERAGDDTGFTLRVELLRQPPDDGSSSRQRGWTTTEHVRAAGDRACNSAGTSEAASLDGNGAFESIATALAAALEGPSTTPITARASVVHWP